MNWARRVVDVVLTASVLVLLSPLLLIIALAVRLDSPGSVFYSEIRLGLNGTPFRIHKFRSLQSDTGPLSSVAPTDDPRITQVGQFLRRTKLDELPQLFDVLRGKMRLVGPRPEIAEHLTAIPDEQRRELLSIRPGITGPSAIAFIAEDKALEGIAEPESIYRDYLVPIKVGYDLAYIRDHGLLTDIRLLLETLIILFSSRRKDQSARMIESKIRLRDEACDPIVIRDAS